MGAIVTYEAVITPADIDPAARELTVIRTVHAGISGPAEGVFVGNPTIIGDSGVIEAAEAALTRWGYTRTTDWREQEAYNGPWLVATLTRD
jgi:hypothetical protein